MYMIRKFVTHIYNDYNVDDEPIDVEIYVNKLYYTIYYSDYIVIQDYTIHKYGDYIIIYHDTISKHIQTILHKQWDLKNNELTIYRQDIITINDTGIRIKFDRWDKENKVLMF